MMGGAEDFVSGSGQPQVVRGGKRVSMHAIIFGFGKVLPGFRFHIGAGHGGREAGIFLGEGGEGGSGVPDGGAGMLGVVVGGFSGRGDFRKLVVDVIEFLAGLVVAGAIPLGEWRARGEFVGLLLQGLLRTGEGFRLGDKTMVGFLRVEVIVFGFADMLQGQPGGILGFGEIGRFRIGRREDAQALQPVFAGLLEAVPDAKIGFLR